MLRSANDPWISELIDGTTVVRVERWPDRLTDSTTPGRIDLTPAHAKWVVEFRDPNGEMAWRIATTKLPTRERFALGRRVVTTAAFMYAVALILLQAAVHTLVDFNQMWSLMIFSVPALFLVVFHAWLVRGSSD